MTSLAVASYRGRIGKEVDPAMQPLPMPVQLQRANARIAILESENRSLSKQVSDLVFENMGIKQRRRRAAAEISFDDIVEAVSIEFGVSPLILMKHTRFRNHTLARNVICVVALEMTDLGLSGIGRALGGRDHSTIHHSIDRTEKRRLVDPDLDETIIKIISDLDGRRRDA